MKFKVVVQTRTTVFETIIEADHAGSGETNCGDAISQCDYWGMLSSVKTYIRKVIAYPRLRLVLQTLSGE